MKSESQTLVDNQKFPAVSLILPVHPKFPEAKEDSEQMIVMLKNAEKQLQAKYGTERCKWMMNKIRKVVSEIPWHHLSKSLLIYVSPETEKIISIPFTVTEKVIVDTSFEIRDLLYASQMDKNYLVVVISKNAVRTFSGNRSGLFPVHYPDMPDNLKDVVNEHSFPPVHIVDKQAFDEKNVRNYLHFIDEVLEKSLNEIDAPVIIMGDVKLLGYFRQHSKNLKKIAGYVEGNYEHANMDVIKNKLEPVIEKITGEEAEKAITLLNGAMSNDHYAAGITEVWRAAAEGKGRLLLVEQDYHQRARHGDDRYTIIPDDSEVNPHNVLSDAVDDVIELVLKNNGDVIFLKPGKLASYNQIALVTRY